MTTRESVMKFVMNARRASLQRVPRRNTIGSTIIKIFRRFVLNTKAKALKDLLLHDIF